MPSIRTVALGEAQLVGGVLPDLPDIWADVGTRELPAALVAAYESHNWPAVREELSTVMDGAITDGAYGRELLQLVLELPPGVDQVFDLYRAAAMLDHGDWDGLRSASGPNSREPGHVRGVREILTAPVDREELPVWSRPDEKWLFQIIEYNARRAVGPMRHWAQRVSGVMPEALWQRSDIAVGRHLRFRQLHDITILAIAESQGGRLEVAHALSSEAQRLRSLGTASDLRSDRAIANRRVGNARVSEPPGCLTRRRQLELVGTPVRPHCFTNRISPLAVAGGQLARRK